MDALQRKRLMDKLTRAKEELAGTQDDVRNAQSDLNYAWREEEIAMKAIRDIESQFPECQAEKA